MYRSRICLYITLNIEPRESGVADRRDADDQTRCGLQWDKSDWGCKTILSFSELL